MKNTNIYKITAFVIFLNLLLHTALLHNFFTAGVICIEQNGNTRIENLTEFNKLNSNLFDYTFNKNILNPSHEDCNNISLDVNCFNDKQIIQKQKDVNRQNTLTALLTTRTLLSKKFNLYSTLKKLSTNNFPLFSYSTVALLI